jgi:transposase
VIIRRDIEQVRVEIDGEWMRVHLFVATLGYSRRPFVQALQNERHSRSARGVTE